MADPGNVLVGAGDIAYCSSSSGDEATAAVLDTIGGTVFTLGDAINSSTATVQDFVNCYQPSWGRHLARTRPTVGDREYQLSGAGGYYTYFGGAAVTGDSAKYYYSYDLAGWHVVVLNTRISMSKGSAQELWLKNDLAAHPAACTIAMLHQPLFYTSGTYSSTLPAWNDLYGAGAELVLAAHLYNYERFAPQRPDGVADPAFGLREIIVGTGGYKLSSFGSTPAANSEVRDKSTYGVLKVTLNADNYHWDFIPVAGHTFTDSGTTYCHGAPPPIAKPGGPYSGEGPLTFDGSKSVDYSGGTITSYTWDFGDGTTGTGSKPTHTYAAYGTYTVTLTVTSTRGTTTVTSAPATTTATSLNIPPAITMGPSVWLSPGDTYTLQASFTDPGKDGPFAVSVDWGDGSSPYATSMTSTGTITGSHEYDDAGSFVVQTTVIDANGGTSTGQLTVLTKHPSDQASILIGAGDIADCGSHPASSSNAELTAEVLDGQPGTVFTAGDDAYSSGSLSQFTNCFGPTWGRHDARMRPSVGNHDYGTSNASGYWNYFKSNGVFVGDSAKYYYSFDVPPDWHVVVLNDNISVATGSTQLQWLQADLAAHPAECTLAIFHHPRIYGGGSNSTLNAIWTTLYNAGADLIVNGHMHHYERFAPMDPSNNADPARGLREIIVGTGGTALDSPGGSAPNAEVMTHGSFGVLKLWLDIDGYYWQFLPIAGQTFTDAGYTACH